MRNTTAKLSGLNRRINCQNQSRNKEILRTLGTKKKSRQFWNRCFEDAKWDYKTLANKNWSDFINKLKRLKVKKVLDLGCGYGTWSIVMARAGFKVRAVDISKRALGILKEWANEEKLFIKTQICSAQKFKSKEKFDAIICNSVLDHMVFNDTKIAINRIRYILSPKGIAYFSFDGPSEDKKDKKGFILLDDGTRYYIKGKFKGMLWRYYTDEEIKILCKNLKIIEFRVRKHGRRYVWMKKKPRFSLAMQG